MMRSTAFAVGEAYRHYPFDTASFLASPAVGTVLDNLMQAQED